MKLMGGSRTLPLPPPLPVMFTILLEDVALEGAHKMVVCSKELPVLS